MTRVKRAPSLAPGTLAIARVDADGALVLVAAIAHPCEPCSAVGLEPAQPGSKAVRACTKCGGSGRRM